mgnify:FL=1
MLKEPGIVVCRSEADLGPAASALLSAAPGARVFALYGPMGAGKTTFIKALCRELGVTDPVQSPTFAIVHEYSAAGGNPVFHFDFYRIGNVGEVYDIGYEDYLYSGHYCFLEWPERVEHLLPPGTVRVQISGTQERTITYGLQEGPDI